MYRILSLIIIGMGLWSLYTGSVPAGSRGFKANRYSRDENPFLFYLFVAMYLGFGLFLFLATPGK